MYVKESIKENAVTKKHFFLWKKNIDDQSISRIILLFFFKCNFKIK